MSVIYAKVTPTPNVEKIATLNPNVLTIPLIINVLSDATYKVAPLLTPEQTFAPLVINNHIISTELTEPVFGAQTSPAVPLIKLMTTFVFPALMTTTIYPTEDVSYMTIFRDALTTARKTENVWSVILPTIGY